MSSNPFKKYSFHPLKTKIVLPGISLLSLSLAASFMLPSQLPSFDVDPQVAMISVLPVNNFTSITPVAVLPEVEPLTKVSPAPVDKPEKIKVYSDEKREPQLPSVKFDDERKKSFDVPLHNIPEPAPQPEPVPEPAPAPAPEPEPAPEPVQAPELAPEPAKPAPAPKAAVEAPRATVASVDASMPTREQVIAYAKSLVGTPYASGGTTPSGFDCSGYTQYVFAQVGVKLPRTSGAQGSLQRVSASEAIPGDLVAMDGHVGIYAGDGKMYHSPRPGKSVQLAPIYTPNHWFVRVL